MIQTIIIPELIFRYIHYSDHSAVCECIHVHPTWWFSYFLHLSTNYIHFSSYRLIFISLDNCLFYQYCIWMFSQVLDYCCNLIKKFSLFFSDTAMIHV